MYSILLVDDEVNVRDCIIEKTPWNDLGFELKAEANNGLEALELFEEERFDVIITDIQMPYLSGIEFIERIREIDPAVTIIILSGYDEFTYAQKAIKYDVLEYLLKPLTSEDIKDLLKRTKKHLDNQIAKYKDQITIKKAYEKQIPFLKEKFLVNLLTSPEVLGNIKDVIDTYDIKIKDGFKCVLLFEASKECSKWEETSIRLLNILKDLQKKDLSLCHFLMGKYIVLIHSVKYIDDSEKLFLRQTERLVKEIKAFANKYEIRNFYIGIGSVIQHSLDLYQSYNKALVALNHCYNNNLEYVLFNDIIQNKKDKTFFETLKKKELSLAIKSNDCNKIKNIIIQSFSNINIDDITPRLIDIISIINECGEQYNLSLNELTDFNKNNIFLDLSYIKTSSLAQEWAIKHCIEVANQLNLLREKSSVKFVEDAKKEIDKNYTNSYYSLEDLCDIILISPSYFSSTFKKEVGKSFVQYITEKRIEYAKELLTCSDLKTYEIAKKVGFAESNYFSYCFKKYTGFSPSKYRNNNEKEI